MLNPAAPESGLLSAGPRTGLDDSALQRLQERAPRRGALLRVSDESRKRFESNLADDLDWLTWSEEATWVKSNVKNVEAFRATTAGAAERTRLGMTPIYARGTDRLIGGQLRRGEWLFVFLLTTAAKADLPDGGNSATEAIKDMLDALAGTDPHSKDRPVLYAHALDRILRQPLFAWQVFSKLNSTYVLINAAGTEFDSLLPNSSDAWTLITFSNSKARDETTRKFQVKRMNTARAGDWPGPELGLPHGFRASAELDGAGRWNLKPADGQKDMRIVRRPEPDPRQRWIVKLIAELYAQPLSYTEIAVRAGQAGVTSKGVDEEGQTLDQLSDLTSAGKLLLGIEKIRAYMTGKLAHAETGVTPGQFSPGDGHQLTPRFPGDDLGWVVYDVNVGLPDGWDWGVPRSTWQRIVQTRYLPAGWQPAGWSWGDEEWDWDSLRAAAASDKAPRAATGRHAANKELRPLSGSVTYADATSRSALFAKTGAPSPDRERYEWRCEQLSAARAGKDGALYAMRATDGLTMSSWLCSELHAVLAEVLTTLVAAALDQGVTLARLVPAPLPPTAVVDRRKRLLDDIARKQKQAASLREDAEGYGLKAARALRNGDEPGADRAEHKEKQALADADLLDLEVQQLNSDLDVAGGDLESKDAAVGARHDFGMVAAVIGALQGPFAYGPAPRSLNEAVRRLFRDSLRFRDIDPATVQLSGAVHLDLIDGTTRVLPFSRRLGRSRMRRQVKEISTGTHVDLAVDQRRQRNDALRDNFWAGCSMQQLLALARSSDQTYLAKRMVEQAPPSVAGTVTDTGLLRALVNHPLGAARALLASELSGCSPVRPECEGGVAGVSAEMARLLRETYRGTSPWTARSPLSPTAEGRLAIISVLAALPDPAKALPVDALAELAGVAPRYVTAVSSTVTRVGGTIVPPSLQRPGNWGGSASSLLAARQRTVALHACPWQDCPSPVAAGICLQPEVIRGCRTTVLCLECERPPTRDVRLIGYRELCAPLLRGQWVKCSQHRCTRDLGAGPGLLWRFHGSDEGLRHAACSEA